MNIGKETLSTVNTQNSTKYTDSLIFERMTGVAAVLITSSAGSITVSQQCSIDNINWYDPKDNAGNAVGVIGTTLTSITTGVYITYSPVLAKYARLKVVENNSAAANVTIQFLFQETQYGI